MTLKELTAKAPGPFALSGVIAIMVAMFAGWGNLGPLAWAKDTDKKIQEAIEPIKREVSNLADDTKIVVLDLWAAQMREAKRNLCNAPPNSQARERELQEIERLQGLYSKRAGARYEVPDCGDL
jgi:hypothetical protein